MAAVSVILIFREYGYLHHHPDSVKRGDIVYFQSGGGIVADSVTENEFQETLNKSGAVKDALMKTTEAE